MGGGVEGDTRWFFRVNKNFLPITVTKVRRLAMRPYGCLKKNFRIAGWLFAASGNRGGQPHRCQFVADFTGNWPGVPRSPDPLGRWSNPWRVPQPLPAGEECLGAGPDGTG